MAKTIGLMRLGRDAEVRFIPSGEAVANLSLVYNHGKADADGNRPSQWIDAAIWGKRAEALAPYLLKGTQHCFTLEGVHIEEFEGKNGKGFKLAATVADVELGPRGQGGAAPSQPQEKPVGGQRPNPQQRPAPNFSDTDDDIPF